MFKNCILGPCSKNIWTLWPLQCAKEEQEKGSLCSGWRISESSPSLSWFLYVLGPSYFAGNFSLTYTSKEPLSLQVSVTLVWDWSKHLCNVLGLSTDAYTSIVLFTYSYWNYRGNDPYRTRRYDFFWGVTWSSCLSKPHEPLGSVVQPWGVAAFTREQFLKPAIQDPADFPLACSPSASHSWWRSTCWQNFSCQTCPVTQPSGK